MMDLFRLGPPYSTAYVPDELVEGYESLIWTERYQSLGEFEIKSYDVDRLRALLPEDTLVSHADTREVMKVETHEINLVGEGADAEPQLTIRGRSACSIFEDRWVESNYQKKRRMRRQYTATSAAAVLMLNAVDNASGKDLTRGDTDPDTALELNDYSWPTADVIPNVAITESVTSEGRLAWWQLEEGILYPQLMKILVDADLGLRCLRPVSPNPATVVTVKTGLAERGVTIRTSVPDVTQLRFDIYAGIDRSSSVQFSTLQGHVDKPQYLFSTKDYKTVVEIMSGEISVSDVYRSGESGVTGWRRRVTPYDAGTPELPPKPKKPRELRSNATAAQRRARAKAMDEWIDKRERWERKRDRIVEEFRTEAREAALKELKARQKTRMFTGDISSLSPFEYQKDYYLGDTVTLFGEYGLSTKMIVSEFVRTEDANGDRGFPGLVEP